MLLTKYGHFGDQKYTATPGGEEEEEWLHFFNFCFFQEWRHTREPETSCSTRAFAELVRTSRAKRIIQGGRCRQAPCARIGDAGVRVVNGDVVVLSMRTVDDDEEDDDGDDEDIEK